MKRIIAVLAASVVILSLIASCSNDLPGDRSGGTATITIRLGEGTSRVLTWPGYNGFDETTILHDIIIDTETVGSDVKAGDSVTYEVELGNHTVIVKGYDPASGDLMSYAENSINVKEGSNSCPMSMNQAFDVNDPYKLQDAVMEIISGGNDREYYMFINEDITISGVDPSILSPSFGNAAGITVNIRGDKKITLDTAGNHLLIVNANQTVILRDVDLVGISNDPNHNASLVVVYGSNAKLFMEGSASVSGNKIYNIFGGGVYVTNGGAFTMSSGTISGNYSSAPGGGVCVDDNGSFAMSGGTITDNDTSVGGGGVYVDNNGSFSMSGGTISGNKATGSYTCGGGVLVGPFGSFTMSGGEISNNRAYEAAAVLIASEYTYLTGGSFIMSGGTIKNNTADENVGGVLVGAYGSFTMSGGTISGNSATGSYPCGGGVHVYTDGTFTMSGGEISDNTADEGGGVFVANDNISAGGAFTMSGGTIKDNTANYNGGGVYIDDFGTFDMNGGTIKDNTAKNYGGGVFADNGTFVLNSPAAKSSIDNNTAAYPPNNVCLAGVTITGTAALTTAERTSGW